MSNRLKLAALALIFPLAACSGPVDGDNPEGMPATPTEDAEVSPTSTIGRPEQTFAAEEVEPSVTNEIKGERVEDPAMELTYKWQGTSYAPGGGTVVVVAITNESDAPMPADTLRTELKWNAGNKEYRTADPMTAEAAGVDIVGLDLPLGPGATVNAKFPFDVAAGNLWDAKFTIGNVTFEGNLNN
ncbi:hypothetical protein JKI95_09705 [Corynebacterium aquatimens]|uniref:hypothetical protein n=1 Tax=Corynebacterium TaxID=1716 RepID=UPI001F1FE820|nr:MULTISPECIES: hypothetical protein [Corynebacterium]QYH19374.1 hypothetical protein JKI95_09705 [Corynebacterium aquatimens]UIZ91712.1 hypothetical protein JZY91_08215 [Corynebacterium sp. CNCTC7651]